MKTGKKPTILFLGVFILFTVLFSQSSGYLSQKLMVENNIRDRVKDALSKIIDSHKYVINVDVELEVLDEVIFEYNQLPKISINAKEKLINEVYEINYVDPYIDHSIKMLNYQPQTSIEDGIPKFIDWYLEYNGIKI